MVEHYKELLYYITKKVSNKDYAQDIVQETYTKVISLPKENLINNKRAFLFKVAKNLIIDNARKNSLINEVEYNENDILNKSKEVEEIVLEENRQEVLMRELNKLPEKRKEAFVLYVLEGYSKEKIASIMGISFSAASKHISRASIELKEKMQRKENEL